MRASRGVLAAVAIVCSTVRADPPKWEYKKPEEVKKKVEWKVSAQLGLILTTGNSNNLSFSAGASASRFDGKNKLSLDVNGAYARAVVITAVDQNGDGRISPLEISNSQQETTALWNVALRYDRFFTKNNSVYAALVAYGNKPAGKTVAGGGQVGYARQLYKSDWHALDLEAGYDYTYVNYVAPNTPDVQLHSLRLFAGYTLTTSKDTQFTAGIEALLNLNPVDIGGFHSDPLGATRVNAKTILTTRVYKMVALRLSFTARYDNAPPPLATFNMLPFVDGFKPRVQNLDTITDASVVVNFL
jgi:hypothetical protein